MFYGFGLGSHWLLYIGVPLIIGIWAQIRVKNAFHKWGEVRASSNITGAECAREILQAAQINDVDVVETNDFLGDHYDPRDKKLHLSSSVYNTPSVAALGIAAHETGHAIQHAKAYAPLKARMAIVPVTMVASQMLPFVILGGHLLSYHRPDYPRHLLLSGPAGLPIDHAAGGIRRLATCKNHFATDGHRTVRRGSCWCKQGPKRGCAHVRGGIHRCAGKLALADVDPRSAVIDCTSGNGSVSPYLLDGFLICCRPVSGLVLSLDARQWTSRGSIQIRSW